MGSSSTARDQSGVRPPVILSPTSVNSAEPSKDDCPRMLVPPVAAVALGSPRRARYPSPRRSGSVGAGVICGLVVGPGVGHTVAEVGNADGVAVGSAVAVAVSAATTVVAVGGRGDGVSVAVVVAVGGKDVGVSVAVAAGTVAVAVGGRDVGASVAVAADTVAVAVGGEGDGACTAMEVAGDGGGALVGGVAMVGGGAVAVASGLLSLTSGRVDHAHQPRATTSSRIPISPTTVDSRQRVRRGSSGTRSTVPPHAGWMGASGSASGGRVCSSAHCRPA
jgi:hypothetical protein